MKINAVLKALAHPIRREIISLLQEEPMTAGAIADRFQVSKPTMSTHFSALKEAGLIFSERDGVTLTYHLDATVAEEALSMMMDLLKVGEATSVESRSSRNKPA